MASDQKKHSDTDSKQANEIGEHKVRVEVNTKTLYKNYAPEYKNSNKAAVFKKCVNVPEIVESSDCDHIITFSRYEHGKSLPPRIPNPSYFIDNNFILKPNIYTYTPTEHPSDVKNKMDNSKNNNNNMNDMINMNNNNNNGSWYSPMSWFGLGRNRKNNVLGSIPSHTPPYSGDKNNYNDHEIGAEYTQHTGHTGHGESKENNNKTNKNKTKGKKKDKKQEKQKEKENRIENWFDYEFHVNFADANLFGFYKGSLFAQDEIQSMEHPLLGSLREYLLDRMKTDGDEYRPTCANGGAIVMNVPRQCEFDIEKLPLIYGNRFASTPEYQVLRYVKGCNDKTSNIIAIACLFGINKKYEYNEISGIFQTAIAGFYGARQEANRLFPIEKNMEVICPAKYSTHSNDSKEDSKDSKDSKKKKKKNKKHKNKNEISSNANNKKNKNKNKNNKTKMKDESDADENMTNKDKQSGNENENENENNNDGDDGFSIIAIYPNTLTSEDTNDIYVDNDDCNYDNDNENENENENENDNKNGKNNDLVSNDNGDVINKIKSAKRTRDEKDKDRDNDENRDGSGSGSGNENGQRDHDKDKDSFKSNCSNASSNREKLSSPSSNYSIESKDDIDYDKHEPRIIIHSGNWGCGAFGGNIELHAMLQIIACVVCGIDCLYYHSVDNNSKKHVENACKLLKKMFTGKYGESIAEMEISIFLLELERMNFRWGMPNGT